MVVGSDMELEGNPSGAFEICVIVTVIQLTFHFTA